MSTPSTLPALHHPKPADPAAARDARIVRTLADLDKLAERGEADWLIAPWRERLAELRPKRALSLLRLLCDPLDPLIVPGHAWRRGSPGIARTALGSLGRVVYSGLADTAAMFDAAVAGHSSDETEIVAAVGARLWPRAGEILATADMPADWTASTGLGANDYAVLASAVAALLAQAVPLRRLAADAARGVEPGTAELLSLLTAMVPAGPVAIAMMVVLLMGSMPRSQRLIGLADELVSRQDGPAGRAVADGAIDFALDSLEDTPLRGADMAHATRHIRCAAIMLGDMDTHTARRPGRRARIDRVRRKLDAACRKRFTTELDTRLLAPAARVATADETEIAALEATARALHRFSATACHVGGAAHYDNHLRRAAEALRPIATEAQAARIHRVRLMEILIGHDAALALLKAGPPEVPGA